jgi:Polysaccharide lyase
MNYSFKLSRRMARFRAAVPIAATFLTLSCSDDPSGPGSNATSGPNSVAISPDSVSVNLNQAVQFDASTDSSITLTAYRGGKGQGRGRKAVVSVAVAPETTAVNTGASNRFNATATLSDGTTTSPSLSWTATGGTVDQTGLYTAGRTSGTYQVIAAAANGVADTADVTVASNTPTPVRVTLSPGTTTLVLGSSTTSVQFTLLGKASDGTTVGVSPVFAATGGSITPAGLYSAGQTAGSYRVIATDQGTGLADTAAVTIAPATITVQSFSVSPATISLTSGKTQQFAASATMSDGSTRAVAAAWSATGGSIASSGLYTAGQTAGSYRVIASDTASGRADTAAVTITTASPTLQALVLTPTPVSLVAGGTQQFSAAGKLSDGSTAPITASFVATGGTISSSGFYTAGPTAGTFRVIATQSGGTLADTAAVSVTAASPAPSGGTTYFLADAESGSLVPPWSDWGIVQSGGALLPTTSTVRTKSGARAFKYEIGPSTDATNKSQTLSGGPQTSMGSASRFLSGYYSFWVYIDAGYTQPQWNMLLGWMTGETGAPDPIMHVGLETYGGQLQLILYPKNCTDNLVPSYTCPTVPGYVYDHGEYHMTASSPAGVVAFPRAKWVHVAAYYKMARSGGQVTLWQDGVKIMDITDPTLNTEDGFWKFNNTANDMIIQFGVYGPGSTETRRIYVDDFKVTNYRTSPTVP